MSTVSSRMASSYFSWAEILHSPTASRLELSNNPPAELLPKLQYTALQMDKVRKLLNRPVVVSSWYRSSEVNKAVGSKSTKSQHISGEAVDFICPSYGSPRDVAKLLEANLALLKFDQLIYEFTWVHISFSLHPRGQALTLDSKTGTVQKGIL